MSLPKDRLLDIYQRLFDFYGPRSWWPANTAFEVMVGAILTQNTAWTNVEKAMANLRAANALDPEVIVAASHEQLAQWLHPSGYFNIKAKRLRGYCEWYLDAGGYDGLATLGDKELREAVLAVYGIGPETADDIVLYAFERPVFVIDTYTRRIFSRLQLIDGTESYETLRAWFEESLGPDVSLFNEFHALIDGHAGLRCRVKPRCDACCLRDICHFEA